MPCRSRPPIPDLAIRKFQAVVDLYGNGSDDENEWVRLAREELKRLQRQVAEDVVADQKVIEAPTAQAQRLDFVRSLRLRAKLRQAVVTLYGDKPWAAQLGRARPDMHSTPDPACGRDRPPELSPKLQVPSDFGGFALNDMLQDSA